MVFVDFSKALGGPGYGSYWGSMATQRSSQQWSRHYISELWRMLVLEGKSRNRSASQMGSSKVMYWPPRSSPSPYQQCSTRLSETWGWRLYTVQTERWSIQRRTLQSEDQDYSDTERAPSSHVTFKDTIKRNLKLRDIKIDSWTSTSQQGDTWRATVNWGEGSSLCRIVTESMMMMIYFVCILIPYKCEHNSNYFHTLLLSKSETCKAITSMSHI